MSDAKATFLSLAAVAILLMAQPPAAEAKTLVYCAEASPDTFDPAIASGVRDASATAIYNRLVCNTLFTCAGASSSRRPTSSRRRAT